MLRRFVQLAALVLVSFPAQAQDRAGAFDYYVLALSWSPTWCALEGTARNAPQCDRPLGWVLHGLWPQYDRGYPEYCAGTGRDPSRAQTGAMADIMGTSGAAWYQWKKHGRCSGLEAGAYFDLARRAYDGVARPEMMRRLPGPVRLPAQVVEQAFLADNPALSPDAITITCKAGRIQEARICLSRDDLTPIRCGPDVVRDCAMTDALLDPVR